MPSSNSGTMSHSHSVSAITDKMTLQSTENKDAGVHSQDLKDDNLSEDTAQYINGIKLYAVIAGLTMVVFLMMLDSTIVTTVCCILSPIFLNRHGI